MIAYTSEVIARFAGERKGQEVRVSVVNYRGAQRVDIRLWVEEAGDWKPNKKGVRLPVSDIPALKNALDVAARVAA